MSKPLAEKPRAETKVDCYKFGAVLGKGGFGTVYSCLDEEKGGFYAIKQVSLNKIPKDQLSGIMQEIDLLKNLNHSNIVKYIKYIRTKSDLYIVLELVENGSLSSIVKRFGKFPENLVCVYITQVLEGLVYLHEQGVVHRDIKGANILTTKEGIIKLADFGVATKFGDESAAVVAGTPYWMAPEIIELNGSTTASDIWSVGCTVIELLTGDPPYYELGPMPALFRIVQDDYPPLPEGISPALKDWLMQCFQKDPVLRISAQKLLNHKWIKAKRKDIIQPGVSKIENPEALIVNYNEKVEQLKNAPLKDIPPPKVASKPKEEEIEDWDMDMDIKPDPKKSAPLSLKLPQEPAPKLKRPEKRPEKKPAEHNTLVKTLRRNEETAQPKKSYVEEDDDDDWSDFGTPSTSRLQLKLPLKEKSSGNLLLHRPKSTSQPPPPQNRDKDKDKDKEKPNGLGKWQEKDEGWDEVGGKLGKLALGSSVGRSIGKKPPQAGQSAKDIFDDIEDDLAIFDDVEELDDVLQKDVWSKMTEDTVKLMNKLQLSQGEAVILDAARQLTTVFKENSTQKAHLIRNIGVIPIMEMLEGTNPRVIHSILQVVNQIVEDNIEIKENLCLVGGIPAVMKFSLREYSLPIRLECAHFISEMCSSSTVTLQMFIACRGLPILVDMLATSYNESKILVWMATESICSVFELQSPTPKNDFCRLFSKCGLLPVLASVLRVTSSDPEAVAKGLPGKIANLFLFFSSADGVVKLAMSQADVLSAIFEPLDNARLTPDVSVKLLKGIKQLSMDHNTLSNLHSAGTIRRLVRVLARHDGPNKTDMHNHALNTLYNMCRLDQDRQYTAAQDGVVPHLMYVIESQSPLRQFALPVMCDLAHVKRARAELWKHRAVEFYLDLLSDKYWTANALDSLSVWLMDDTTRVEKILAAPAQIAKVVVAFGTAEFNTLSNMMDPLLHIVEASPKVNEGLGTSPDFVPMIVERLSVSIPKAEVRVNMLRILTRLYKCHPQPKTMIAEFNLYPVVKALTMDKIVLVQKLASQLLVAFNTNTVL